MITNTSINPQIVTQKCVAMMLEAFEKSGTIQKIEDYVSCRESLCPLVSNYLTTRYGMDRYDILYLESDIASELMHVLELRAKEQLQCSDEEAYEFSVWMTSEPREDEFFKSLVHHCLVGAFLGEMEHIDKAITVYSEKLAA